MTIKSDIYDMAKKQGYEGGEPNTISDAIDALADTLAGEDVDSGHTIAEAVRALAPYVGGGGGEVLGLNLLSATPPNSMRIRLTEDGNDVAFINATNSAVHGEPASSSLSGAENYAIAQHVWVELRYPTPTYTSVSVKTLAGDEYPHTVVRESGYLYVRLTTPEMGKDAYSPVVILAS